MNLLLHGIRDADVRNDDTLANPLHVKGGELERSNRVITNPPFSQNYDRDGIPFPERFAYGWTPEGGKKADLMFLQHMLAVLSNLPQTRDDGAQDRRRRAMPTVADVAGWAVTQGTGQLESQVGGYPRSSAENLGGLLA